MSATHGEQVLLLEEHGQEGARSINWWGMIFFIASEALIFANLIAAYLYLEIRDGSHIWSVKNLIDTWWLSIINTGILLISSAFVHMAGSGIRKGNRKQTLWGLAATITLGVIFLSGQAFEYGELVNRNFTLQTGTFGSSFFTLTGFHGLHVTVGVIFLLICLIRTMRGDFTQKKHFALEAGEMYWHFVDVVWIFVFTVVYLVPLLRG
jgi:heme/copper-type cytochrome/quinol oxidase subunit 3